MRLLSWMKFPVKCKSRNKTFQFNCNTSADRLVTFFKNSLFDSNFHSAKTALIRIKLALGSAIERAEWKSYYTNRSAINQQKIASFLLHIFRSNSRASEIQRYRNWIWVNRRSRKGWMGVRVKCRCIGKLLWLLKSWTATSDTIIGPSPRSLQSSCTLMKANVCRSFQFRFALNFLFTSFVSS